MAQRDTQSQRQNKYRNHTEKLVQLRVNTAITNSKPTPNPNWFNTNTHTKGLAKGKPCSSLSIKKCTSILMVLYRTFVFQKEIMKHKEKRLKNKRE